ncbi:hypothetical protein [Aquibaculum sediminis]|uniref:hypothetical protein n=1 Tax=Aquibaculum sediminis TaxID=3231907 RepID=UPI00345445B3
MTFSWRPRAGLLRRDLADLAADLPVVWPAAVQRRRRRLDEAGCWGLLYVLEGSRLSGRVLVGLLLAVGWYPRLPEPGTPCYSSLTQTRLRPEFFAS